MGVEYILGYKRYGGDIKVVSNLIKEGDALHRYIVGQSNNFNGYERILVLIKGGKK